ncbi:MAG TPA: tRNA lysidine(34) synthetase TilS, partial [Saprospiraceae bacterium]|nr:tRNA lysidine(34) synthetase TilS [Saprospiraceae bacterium]
MQGLGAAGRLFDVLDADVEPDTGPPSGPLTTLRFEALRVTYPDGREAVLVDAARLHFPLSLRPWQAGDWFMPFGMGGKRQKLQDFFVNQKLTRIDKEQVWVLENGDGAIIWVLGHRLDERFRVSADTAQALKIGLA